MSIDYEKQSAVDVQVAHIRLERALRSAEEALEKLERRGDVSGLQRLRDDLRTALRLSKERLGMAQTGQAHAVAGC